MQNSILLFMAELLFELLLIGKLKSDRGQLL